MIHVEQLDKWDFMRKKTKQNKKSQVNPQISYVTLLFVLCQPLSSGALAQGVATWRAHTELDFSTSKTKKKEGFYDQSRRSHLPALGPYVSPAHF